MYAITYFDRSSGRLHYSIAPKLCHSFGALQCSAFIGGLLEENAFSCAHRAMESQREQCALVSIRLKNVTGPTNTTWLGRTPAIQLWRK